MDSVKHTKSCVVSARSETRAIVARRREPPTQIATSGCSVNWLGRPLPRPGRRSKATPDQRRLTTLTGPRRERWRQRRSGRREHRSLPAKITRPLQMCASLLRRSLWTSGNDSAKMRLSVSTLGSWRRLLRRCGSLPWCQRDGIREGLGSAGCRGRGLTAGPDYVRARVRLVWACAFVR